MSKSMTKSMMSSRKPLPNNIAMKMMQMVAVMTSTLTSVALDASLEGRDGLWEVACSENSWLTAAANEHGIPSRRINFAQGYDIYKPETWMRLKEERRQRRPKKIWLSLVPSFANGLRSTTTLPSARKCLKACDVVNAEC
jgi:hypothetical protein